MADGLEAPRAVLHDGTWDKVPTRRFAQADAADDIDWSVSIGSTIN